MNKDLGTQDADGFRELVVEPSKIEETKKNPYESSIDRKGLGLSVKNVEVSFSGIKALDNISFTIDPGEKVGLIGNNGAGKSTLCDVISGLNSYSGQVFINSVDVTKKSAIKRAKMGMRRVFQHPALFEDLSIEENVIVGSPPSKGDSLIPSVFFPRMFYKEKLNTAKQILDYCSVETNEIVPIEQLPYATKKRIELARALMGNPRILILDEPAASMNDVERAQYAQVVNDYAETFNTTLLIVEHDLNFIKATCDRAIVLDAGELISDGPVLDVLRDEDVMRRYFGEDKK